MLAVYILICGTSNIGLGDLEGSVALNVGRGLLDLTSGVNTMRGRIKAAEGIKPAGVSASVLKAGFFISAAGAVASGTEETATDTFGTASSATGPGAVVTP